MWEDSWVNLRIKMADMPHFEYDSKKQDEPEAKEGSIEDLKKNFGKYIK